MTKTIVFDVNETMLDMAALDPLFEKHFGDPSVRKQWFSQLLMTTMSLTLVGDYSDFAKVGMSALGMVAARRGADLSDDDKIEILNGLRLLPSHPDIAPALAMLKGAGYRLVTLANSPPAVVEAQLEYAGLSEHFEATLSVDKVKAFKPAPSVYQMAADELGEPAGSLWLVAAHNWDTTGALAAGWKAAFIARPGMVLGSVDRKPNIVASDMEEIARGIIGMDAR